jgi:hypothetical protein
MDGHLAVWGGGASVLCGALGEFGQVDFAERGVCALGAARLLQPAAVTPTCPADDRRLVS